MSHSSLHTRRRLLECAGLAAVAPAAASDPQPRLVRREPVPFPDIVRPPDRVTAYAESYTLPLKRSGTSWQAEDIVVTTVDLSKESALIIAQDGNLKGTGTQHPYDQGVAEGMLALYALVTRMRLPDSRDLGRIALAGLTGITIYHVALNFGEVTVTAGAASLLIAAGPVFTALMSVAFLGERLTPFGWLGIAVAFLGVAMISLSQGGGVSFAPGALLILLAAVSTSAFFIISKKPLTHYSALEFTSYSIWAGTIPLLVFAPGLAKQFPTAAPTATLAIIYLGIFPAAIAYVLWNYALARMPASILSSFLYLSPVLAMAIAWIWIGEIPTWLTVLGGAIAIAGVVIVQTRGQARRVAAAAVENPIEASEI
jgi:drug/metabolite transporter (DMT)-like permease